MCGFTSAQWSSPQETTNVRDPTAILFNLTDKRSYPCLEPELAICCDKYWGPSFGFEDLITGSPFNYELACST